MKNSHAPLLLLAPLLASGCAARKPANFRDLAPLPPEELNAMAEESEWTITVTVDAGRGVFFRKERVGTTDEVGPLGERVRQAIERNRRAARDRGEKELVGGGSIVFVCAAPGLEYGDVSKAVDAIREAGGAPIGLKMDCSPPR